MHGLHGGKFHMPRGKCYLTNFRLICGGIPSTWNKCGRLLIFSAQRDCPRCFRKLELQENDPIGSLRLFGSNCYESGLLRSTNLNAKKRRQVESLTREPACIRVDVYPRARLRKEWRKTGRASTQDEQKKNKECISSFARETYEGYKTKVVEHITQTMQEEATPLTPRQFWTNHVDVKKGHIYSLESSVCSADTGYGRKSVSDSPSHMQQISDNMWEQYLFDVRQKIMEEVRKEFEECELALKKEMKKMMRQMMRGEFDDDDVIL